MRTLRPMRCFAGQHGFVYVLRLASRLSKTPHFGGCAPRGGGYGPKIRTRSKFLYDAPTHKFHRPMFTRSEVIVLTVDTQTHKQAPTKTSNVLRYTLRRWVKTTDLREQNNVIKLKPGLGAFYAILPGNVIGPILQLKGPHEPHLSYLSFHFPLCKRYCHSNLLTLICLYAFICKLILANRISVIGGSPLYVHVMSSPQHNYTAWTHSKQDVIHNCQYLKDIGSAHIQCLALSLKSRCKSHQQQRQHWRQPRLTRVQNSGSTRRRAVNVETERRHTTVKTNTTEWSWQTRYHSGWFRGRRYRRRCIQNEVWASGTPRHNATQGDVHLMNTSINLEMIEII